MAPGLISQFKCFSFPTPPSFLTFKDKKNNMKKKRCIWKKGLLIPANRHQQTKNWPGVIWTHDLNVLYIFFLLQDFDFKNETWEWTTHSPQQDHYPPCSIHAVSEWAFTSTTKVLLLPRGNLPPDAIHWSAASCLNNVSHRFCHENGQNCNACKHCSWYGCPSVLSPNILLS